MPISLEGYTSERGAETVARILVVDDNPEVAGWLEVELTAAGHRVSSAENGKMALAAIEKDLPDLLILDIDMPVMDGHGVLKRLRQLPRQDRLRVLILTGRTAEAEWVKGYKQGAHVYLTKPFEADELHEAIAKVMEMTDDQLNAHRDQELELAELLSKLEAMFDSAPEAPPSFEQEQEPDPEPPPRSRPASRTEQEEDDKKSLWSRLFKSNAINA
jgi:DNA-binding response OmpR family regulator